MPNISFLKIVNYLESLAEKHVDINDSYRWNISEVTGAFKKGIELPVMLIDSVETQTKGDKTKTIHDNSIAFTIIGKPNTKTGNLDNYEAQNLVLDFCQGICFDMETLILFDSEQVKDQNGNKNWLYGRVEKNSFHHFKVGPIFSEGLYGYRCELKIKNQLSTIPNPDKWNHLT